MRSILGSRRGLTALGLAAAAALLVTVPGTATAAPAEVSLAPHYNHLGTTAEGRLPAMADFDGGGYSYSAAALQAGNPARSQPGIVPGQKITAGGFQFTWPAPAAGQRDNVVTLAQTIPVPTQPGATSLGFLGDATQGNQNAPFTLTYETKGAGGSPVEETVDVAVGFTDWTRGLAGDGALESGNTVVLETVFRHSRPGTIVYGTRPNVFLVSVPLEPGKTLKSVTLPYNTNIHLWAMAVK